MLRKTSAGTNVLMVLCALSFFLYLDRVNLSAAAGSIKAEFGFSNTTIGMAFSAFGYSYALFQSVGRLFIDRPHPPLPLTPPTRHCSYPPSSPSPLCPPPP